MFPRSLTTALHNYLDTEMGWARHGSSDGKPDADVGGSVTARLALLDELDAPYPARGEPLVTAVREFVHTRGAFERCAELDTGLGEAADRLEEARHALVSQLRESNVDRTPAPAVGRPEQSVLVAVDDDEQAERAVRVAGELAQNLGAGVVVLHVVAAGLRLGRDPLAVHRRQAKRRREAVELLARAQRWLPAGFPAERMLREGVAATQIIAAANAINAKMIVLGTRCRGRLAHFVLGSTSEAVARDAECPVVTVGHDRPADDFAKDGIRADHLLATC